MLTPSSREVVAATLPAVNDALGEITPNFYRRLFATHPELLSNLFNRTHQKTGEQPMALAASIAAFARLQLEPDSRRQRLIIERIAHKHASLGVTRDQYVIVHEHLFAAIVDVLGSAVTPEVAEAWDELYWRLADLLIRDESELHSSAGITPGTVWRDLVVTRRSYAAPDTVSFTLASSNETEMPIFVPGQYISVQVPLSDGAHQIRQYSLIGPTDDRTHWQISVKLAGEVSAYLHEHLFEGDILRASTPFGTLILPEDDSPLLLASSGIGCTPVIGLLTALSAAGTTRSVTVMHADRSRARQPHRGRLKELVESIPSARLYQWYRQGAEYMRSDSIRSGQIALDGIALPNGVHAMLSGSNRFLTDIRHELLSRDIPEHHIHYEAFGSDLLPASR